MMMVEWDASTGFAETLDGPYIFMYIAREGHDLPQLTGSMS